jgi:heme-degrading monooxygenase HmoA
MYATRTEVTVGPGKVRVFEAWWAQLSALGKAQPGFQEGTLLNSLSYPAKYVFLMRWESREARQAWTKGEAFSAFFQANPPQELVTLGRPQEAYDVLFRVTGEGQAAYAGLGDWTLDPRPGNAASFERSRQEIFELRKQHVPGLVLNGLGRLFGHQHRYQVVQFYSTMDALRAASPGSPIPQLHAFGEAHPPSEYASALPSAEVYEGFCRKFAFLRPNVKVVCRKINDL